ncbi:hypothetical protein B566_EDAN018292 [Ephemera danica]|nr:hypothetical protein B566_EDAN018292 [Ephemera danica]
MKSSAVRNADTIRALSKLNPAQRTALLKVADKQVIEAICECVYNILRGNVELKAADALERLKQEPQRTTHPIKTIESQLDSVLSDASLDDRNKWKKYSDIFQRLMLRLKESNEPVSLKIEESTDNFGLRESAQPNVERIVREVPKIYQNKAGLLLDRIQQSEIKWNERGEITVHGIKVPGSNISDLVNDVLRKRKDSNPIGWQKFSEELHRINVPQEFIGNPDRKKIIRREPQRSPSPDLTLRTPVSRKKSKEK